ncbi:P-loop containing nucleoside triphosphate hydrolase protein [Saitoella complicata NRRL Y-17804]|nr:P-loop containing nucleoside triphosphate hydrolase protein [Saitoella complicata NRRL Y-17804]ODQ51619.1 P-loop containing nucleoside triphosphate hydrolase protein [Saitoella complicata NRRL Y-17804]
MDKVQHILPFIFSNYPKQSAAGSAAPRPPLFVGVSGPQGSGKTTLTTALVESLRGAPYGLSVCAFSIDDIYLSYEDQQALKKAHPENKLVAHRGEPGTHDISLGISTFRSLHAQQPTPIPSYDKSAHSGSGDRLPITQWETATPPFDIVIFEGWCVGFRAISAAVLKDKYEAACRSRTGTLPNHTLEDLEFVNDKLKAYDALWDQLDLLVHVDAQDISYVYNWRLQQEHAMIAARGSGMSDEKVREFVDGYMPAYELFVETVREGIMEPRKQLRIRVGEGREVVEVKVL